MGVVPQLDNLDIDVTVEDNLAVFARLYRVPDVAAAVDRALDARPAHRPPQDAVDELSGGMRRRLLLARGLVHEPRLVLLDEPTVGLDPQIRTQIWSLIDGLRSRGHDDPDVDPLHRGGRAARRRGRGDGARQDHRPRQAGRADRRARRRARPPRSTARPTGSPRSARWPSPRACAVRPAGPGDRDRRRRARRRTARSPTTPCAAPPRSRTSSCCSPARRRSERRRDARHPAARAGGDRRRDEPRGRQLPHLLEGDHVLERARADRSTCSPSASASARRSSTSVDGLDYVEFVGTGMVATAVIFSSALPAMFGTFVKHRFQNTYDAILAAPVDVEELVTAEMLWIGLRAGFYGCFPLLVSFVFGLDPTCGMLLVPLFCFITALGFAGFGIAVAGDGREDRPVQLRDDAGDHAAVPGRRHVLPDRPAARGPAGRWPTSTRSTSWSSSSAAPPSASRRSTCCGCWRWSLRARDVAARGPPAWSRRLID